jgi:hypothetical protein
VFRTFLAKMPSRGTSFLAKHKTPNLEGSVKKKAGAENKKNYATLACSR